MKLDPVQLARVATALAGVARTLDLDVLPLIAEL